MAECGTPPRKCRLPGDIFPGRLSQTVTTPTGSASHRKHRTRSRNRASPCLQRAVRQFANREGFGPVPRPVPDPRPNHPDPRRGFAELPRQAVLRLLVPGQVQHSGHPGEDLTPLAASVRVAGRGPRHAPKPRRSDARRFAARHLVSSAAGAAFRPGILSNRRESAKSMLKVRLLAASKLHSCQM